MSGTILNSGNKENITPNEKWSIFVGIFLLLAGFLLAYLIVQLWPTVTTGSGEEKIWISKSTIFWGLLSVEAKGDTCLILLVVLSSCLGSYVHVASSFVYNIGFRRFESSWTWWYMLRTFIGIALALIFYFTLRGGLLTTSAGSETINPYGVSGIAGLVGLFSKQATEKLREVFDTIFRTNNGEPETKTESTQNGKEGEQQ